MEGKKTRAVLPEEESDYSVENSFSSTFGIPQMIMQGSLKDGGKEGHRTVAVPRYCMLRISGIELLDLENTPNTVIFTIGLEKTRKVLRSMPVDLKKAIEYGVPGSMLQMDFCFSFHYMHNIKGQADVLRLQLQNSKKKHQREHKTLAQASLNMAMALQKPFDEELTLFVPKEKKKEKEERKLEKREERELRKLEKKESKRGSKKQEIKDGKKKELPREDPTKQYQLKAREKKIVESPMNTVLPRDKEEGETPFATIMLSLSLYPADVESPQDAQEWDDELMDALVMQARTDISSEEDEDELSSDEEEEVEISPLSPTGQAQAKPISSVETSSTALAELMRSRYHSELKENHAERSKSKLNLKKLKGMRRMLPGKKSGAIHDGGEYMEDVDFFNRDEVGSLGTASSDSEVEDSAELSSSPMFKTLTNPQWIRGSHSDGKM